MIRFLESITWFISIISVRVVNSSGRILSGHFSLFIYGLEPERERVELTGNFRLTSEKYNLRD